MNAIKQKMCKACSVVKDASEFSIGRRTCRPCRSAEQIKKYWDSPEEYRSKKRGKLNKKARTEWQERNKDYQYFWHLNATYGLTKEDYTSLLESQENKCAICGQDAQTRMVVDHCHATGKVRGLLCNSCNCGLGFFQDNVGFMQKAIEYIKSNES